MALTLGATFVARSFSGDKEQLVPILKAGLKHKGFAFIDVISPCVTFNDHQGSTKSYAYTREHMHDVDDVDFVPLRKEITMPTGRRRARARCACTTAASSPSAASTTTTIRPIATRPITTCASTRTRGRW